MFKMVPVLAFYLAFITAASTAPKLCMDTVPKGDKFYALCRKCEKNVKYCSGDLRDRMRELLRQEEKQR
jgi:hypothetical protein